MLTINAEINGISGPCARCGTEPIAVDYIVDTDFWHRFIAKDMILDVVCLPCLLELAGAETLNHLQMLYWTHDGHTIALIPVRVYPQHFPGEE